MVSLLYVYYFFLMLYYSNYYYLYFFSYQTSKLANQQTKKNLETTWKCEPGEHVTAIL